MRTVDYSKCIGCGKCVDDCINQYIVLKENDGHKHASFKERGRCLECGHCNAICPVGAITGGKVQSAIDISDELLLLMAKKRTVRHYKKGSSIDKTALDRIILAAQSAPTDRNRKSARILLVKDCLPQVYNLALDYLVEEVKRTGTINPLYVPTMTLDSNREEILWNAEYLVVFVGSSSNLTDAVISAERMQLEAVNLGIGTAYRGDMKLAIHKVEKLRELLGIKKNEEALVTFAMGISSVEYIRPAVKTNREVYFI